MSVFNLYNEIEQELHFLLPKRGMMLIVFHLYHQMKEHELERTFTEEDIKKSIRAVHSHLKTEQSEQWNQVIRALQKYFLWRDVEQGTYRFRAYAQQLCEGVEKVLYDTFNPTQIEKYFKYIQNSLDVNDFEGWYQTAFNGYVGKVSSQISALDCQVVAAVADFKNKISADESYDVVVLKGIVDTLADIGQKAEELNVAFRSSNEISRKLIDFLATPEGRMYGNEINEVVTYFKEVRDNLGIISRKINGVRPRLNEYVRDINRHDFYKKCKKFVNYVLTQSEVVKGEVCLPADIPEFQLKPERVVKFVIVKENLDLEGTIPRQAKGQMPEITEEMREENYQKDLVAQQKRQRVADYLKELQQQLDTAKEVDFSLFFHRMVEVEKGDLNLMIKWASKALTRYSLDNRYRVEIAQERIVNDKYPWISIWKTVIYKRR